MKSLAQKLEQLEGLVGTKDVTEWQNGFLIGCVVQWRRRGDTTGLTERQIEIIDQIYTRHFAD